MDASLNSYKMKWPELPWPPNEENEKSRVIGERLWRLDEIQNIAEAQLSEGRRLLPITQDCVKDLQKLGFDVNDIARLILQLKRSHYDKSMWCLATPNEGVIVRPERLWYPCDAYAITRVERMASGWEGPASYYLKLCQHSSKALALLLSAHLQD